MSVLGRAVMVPVAHGPEASACLRTGRAKPVLLRITRSACRTWDQKLSTPANGLPEHGVRLLGT